MKRLARRASSRIAGPMARHRITTAALLILFLTLFTATWLSAETVEEMSPVERYLKMHGLYLKWKEGLFGSRKYYENRLAGYLRSLHGKEIETDYRYMLLSPEGIFNKKVRCALTYGGWLKIRGELDTDSVMKVIDGNSLFLRKWWRTTRLVKVSGRVRKFRLAKDPYGDVVELHLYSVVLHDGIKGRGKKD